MLDDANSSPAKVDTTVAFPEMSDMEMVGTLEAPQQPTMKDGMWIWPGPKGTMKKPVVGNFAVDLVTIGGKSKTESSSNDVSDGGSSILAAAKFASALSIASFLYLV